jgi:hypothetical protein
MATFDDILIVNDDEWRLTNFDLMLVVNDDEWRFLIIKDGES